MSLTSPHVSIITPVYNGAEYLERLIHSVQSQSYPALEHIVVDDGSTDAGETVSVLARHPHLRWWTRENKGQYATMNEGLTAAHGEWVCFISADDLMAPQAVETVMNFISANPEAQVVYGRTLFVNENEDRHVVQSWFQHVPPRWYAYLNGIYHCSIYVKRSVLLENSLFFDEGLRFTGDFDWIVRLHKAGLRFAFINKALSCLRTHSGQASVVHKEIQDKELETLLVRHGINRALYRLVSFLLYTRSAGIETITMLKKGQFPALQKRVQRWLQHKLLRR